MAEPCGATVRTRNLHIAVSAGVCLGLALGAPAAQAAPRVLAAGLDRPAVVGSDTGVHVRAVDPAAPVTGMTVASGSESFGLSACLSPGTDGRVPGGPFAAGAEVTLHAPLRFSRTGAQAVVARVDSGGCGVQGGTVYQPLTVTPTRRGEPPVAPTVGLPVTLQSLLPAGPGLPGQTELPGLPALPAASVFPGPLAVASATCPDAHRRVRRDLPARRRARRATLCVINVVRRRMGLRRLRENRRLLRAANGHSASMVRRRYFSHVAPGGVVLSARLRRVGYLPARRSRVGENLAAAVGRRAEPLSIVRAWLGSAPHRTVLLERSFRELGLGVVAGRPNGRRGTTYTADFGFRR